MHNIPPKPQPQPASVDVHKLKFLMHAVRRRVFRTFWNRLLPRLITSLTSLYSLCQKSRQRKPSIKSLPLSNLTKQSQICGSDEGLPLFCQPDQGWVHCGSAPMRWGCKTCDYSTSPFMLFLQTWNFNKISKCLKPESDNSSQLIQIWQIKKESCPLSTSFRCSFKRVRHKMRPWNPPSRKVNFATFGWRLFRYLDTRLSADWPRLPPWLGMDR